MSSIISDEEVFMQIKEPSRKAYRRAWSLLKEVIGEFDFETGPPGEDEFIKFFKYLRIEKKAASSTLWTTYSYLNSVMQRKYSVRLQQIPRLTLLIKSYDTDVKQKAKIFDDDKMKQFMVEKDHSTYWLVRQVIAMIAFFGGLRIEELMRLQLETIQKTDLGYSIIHHRVKQRRSDK